MATDTRPRTARYRPTITWGTGTELGETPYDDVSGFYLNSPGLVLDGIGRDQIRAYAPPVVPAFDLTLNNWGGEFSPGGPIGKLVGRGPRVSLDVIWSNDTSCNAAAIDANDVFMSANGTEIQRLFEGQVNTAQHVLTRPQRTVAVRALGKLAMLLDKRPQATQLYVDLRTDQAIAILLDLCGWDPDMRVLDEGDTTLRYWWLDGSATGLDVLNQLLAAEGAGGAAYEQAGVFHFEGRQSRFNNPRSTTDQWIIGGGFLPNPSANAAGVPTNDSNTLANGLTDITILYDANPSAYASNPDEVIASAALTVTQRVPFPPQVGGAPAEVAAVWEYGGPLVVPAGPTGIVTEGTTDDPYYAPLLPVDGATVPPGDAADYAVVAGGALTSVALEATGGTLVRLRWISAGGCTVNGWTSNGPQLRAVSLVGSDTVVRSTIDTTAQQARYQPRQHTVDAWPEIDPLVARDIVNSMVLRYQSERRQATLKLVNIDGGHMNCILHARIGDRIRWYQAHGQINESYWIETISHEIAPGGGLHTMTLGCERTVDQVGGRFDVGGFDAAKFGD